MKTKITLSIWARESSTAPWTKVKDLTTIRKGKAIRQMNALAKDFPPSVEFEVRENPA